MRDTDGDLGLVVLGIHASDVQDAWLARFRFVPFEPNAREERGEVVVIVLRVLLQRVIVTLSAADARTKKRLRHGGVQRDAHDAGRGVVSALRDA